MFGRALELAFRTEQLSALDQIAGELDETADPKVGNEIVFWVLLEIVK